MEKQLSLILMNTNTWFQKYRAVKTWSSNAKEMKMYELIIIFNQFLN